MTCASRSLSTPRMVWGAVLLLLGAILLLDNLNIVYLGRAWDHWPLILVAIGVGRLLAAGHWRECGSGLWWILIGLWLEVSIHRFWDLGFRESWPILLIGIGTSMVLKSLRRGTQSSTTTSDSLQGDRALEQGERA
ncbi:MAG: hypothetical protein HRF44_02760 [Ignavibacterium sp.]